MKNILSPLALFACYAFMSFSITDPLPIGSELPLAKKKLQDVSGKERNLEESAGKNGLLVMFSCNSCPFVVKNQERTIKIGQFAKRNEIGMVVINSNEAYRNGEDSFEAMKQYAKEQNYNWNYLLDANSELADAFSASRTPECFLFNKELKLVYHGAIDNNPSDAENVSRKHLEIAIDELIAGKDISIKETKSVGCGIKRKK